jgi:PiT family inorganic phosphate transporter
VGLDEAREDRRPRPVDHLGVVAGGELGCRLVDRFLDRHDAVEAFLQAFEAAPMPEKSRMLKELKQQTRLGQGYISKQERKDLRKAHRKNLVKRSVLMRVIAAWIITVPASALMAAVIYYAIRGAMLP